MKTRLLLIAAFALLLPGLFFVPRADAQTGNGTDYQLLEPLPIGPGGTVETHVTTGDYLSNIFRLVLALASVLAVFQLIIGGITYMTTDAFTKKSEAKGKISQTLAGLALVWGAWLIVATLLPGQVNNGAFSFDLSLTPIPSTPNLNVPGTSVGGGLQPVTVSAINGLRQECNCLVRITSTTGDSHDPNSLHYQGLAVDIGANSDLTKFLTGQTTNPRACSTYNKTLNGVSARFLWEPTGSHCGGAVASTGDHWHMSTSK